MIPEEAKRELEWLQQPDVQAYLQSDTILSPWFPAYKHIKTKNEDIAWYSALLPLHLVHDSLLRDEWDLNPDRTQPSVWVHDGGDGESEVIYCPYGNEEGIEPLVLLRDFHGLRESFLEPSQEFQLFHNLWPDPKNHRFVHIDANGDESDAARYGMRFFEVRTDLLRHFLAAKQMALAIYVDGFRHSVHKLEELGLQEARETHADERFHYFLAVIPEDSFGRHHWQTLSRVVGKKIILPGAMPADDDKGKAEAYQEFAIGTDAAGKIIQHTCDPDKLANNFGKNPEAPHYFTSVFFRVEVLAKYHADPRKYSVEDGYLRCGGLWGLRMDNDHPDYVVVFLGDLGRDLSERERNYWLSFNISPEGRKLSATAIKRGFMAEFADPSRPDLAFRHEYEHFRRDFREAFGWEFFLPLHPDDEHFLTTLRLPAGDNQAEFDAQLLALTKVLVDSLNEKQIAHGLTTLREGDKGITKLEKLLAERGLEGYEGHIKFLRVLQDLRSKSAAHRKGSSYSRLVEDLHFADEGQQRVFGALLAAAVDLVRFLRRHLLDQRT